MKKFLGILLSITIVVGFMPSIAWADTAEQVANPLSEETVTEYLSETNSSEKIPLNSQTSISGEIDILSAFGYDDSTIIGAMVSEGDIIYHAQLDGGKYGLSEADIAVNESPEGDVEITFLEDSQEDTLLFTNDGKCFLNGQEVRIVDNLESALEGSTFYRTTSVPVGCGSSTDYTVYGGYYWKNIYLPNLICETGVSVLAACIVYALSGGLLLTGVTPIATIVIREAVVGDGDVAKIKTYRKYSSRTNAFMINSSMGCQQESALFFNKSGVKITNTTLQSYWLYLMTGC